MPAAEPFLAAEAYLLFEAEIKDRGLTDLMGYYARRVMPPMPRLEALPPVSFGVLKIRNQLSSLRERIKYDFADKEKHGEPFGCILKFSLFAAVVSNNSRALTQLLEIISNLESDHNMAQAESGIDKNNRGPLVSSKKIAYFKLETIKNFEGFPPDFFKLHEALLK